MRQNQHGRRRFMKDLGATVTAAGAAALTVGATTATAAGAAAEPFQPARHPEDDWMDKLPGKHRMVVDGVTANGAGEAILFASNLYAANKSAYALGDADLAMIVVLRHWAAPFAFTDAVWQKFGAPLGTVLKFTDPKTQQPPTKNLYNASGYGLSLPNLGSTIDALVKRGTQFAVCDQAMHFAAMQVANATHGDRDAIYKEFSSNLIPNSHVVSAGVVAVSRAQEKGYTLIYAG